MFKENEIAKIKINGRPRKVRVIDIVGDDAMIQHRSGSVSIVDVKELKPILEGHASKAKESKTDGGWFFESQ